MVLVYLVAKIRMAYHPAGFLPPTEGIVLLEPLLRFDFKDPSDLQKWHEHSFTGKTQYEIIENGGEKFLKGASHGTSSVLFIEAPADIRKRPFLTWEWRVGKFPTGKKNRVFGAKRDNDYGARIYVVFKGKLPFQNNVIQYIWDDHFPVHEHRDSPFLRNVKMLVVRHGPPPSGEKWVSEKRDLVRDYQMLFKKRPRDLMVLGIATDSDDTGTGSEAAFKTLAVEIPKNSPAGG